MIQRLIENLISAFEGTGFLISEPTLFSTGWYYLNFNTLGVRYKVIPGNRDKKIKWVNSLFSFRGYLNINKFSLNLVLFSWPGEAVVVENGSSNNSCTTRWTNLSHNEWVHNLLWACYENLKEHIKNFQMLQDRLLSSYVCSWHSLSFYWKDSVFFNRTIRYFISNVTSYELKKMKVFL